MIGNVEAWDVAPFLQIIAVCVAALFFSWMNGKPSLLQTLLIMAVVLPLVVFSTTQLSFGYALLLGALPLVLAGLPYFVRVLMKGFSNKWIKF